MTKNRPKYIVLDAQTERRVGGPTFVLRPDRDPAARIALEAYAEATHNAELAIAIFDWLENLKDVEGLDEEVCDGD